VIYYLICTATAIGTFLSLLFLHAVMFDTSARLLVERVIKRSQKGGDLVTESFRLIKKALVWLFFSLFLPCFKVFFWCFFSDADYDYVPLEPEERKKPAPISIDYRNGQPSPDNSFNHIGQADAGLKWLSGSFARTQTDTPNGSFARTMTDTPKTPPGLFGSPSFIGAPSFNAGTPTNGSAFPTSSSFSNGPFGHSSSFTMPGKEGKYATS